MCKIIVCRNVEEWLDELRLQRLRASLPVPQVKIPFPTLPPVFPDGPPLIFCAPDVYQLVKEQRPDLALTFQPSQWLQAGMMVGGNAQGHELLAQYKLTAELEKLNLNESETP